MLADVPVKKIEQDSFSIEQISKAMGVSETGAKRTASQMVEKGLWEKTYKRQNNRIVQSFKKL